MFFGVVFAGFIGIAGASHGDVVVPLLATQILWIDLVTNSGPAFAMGVDPEIDDVMTRPPRLMSERIIDRGMWLGILAIGLVMGVATLLTMDMFSPGGLIERSESLQVARTAGFTTLALAQLFNSFNSRSQTTSAFHRPFRNRWLWGSVALATGLQIAGVELLPFCKGLSARCRSTWPIGGLRWPWRRWCCGSANCGNCSCGPSIGATACLVLARKNSASAPSSCWPRSRRNPHRFNRQVCTAQVVQPRRRRDRRPAVQHRGRPSRGSTGRRLRRRRWSEQQIRGPEKSDANARKGRPGFIDVDDG